MTPIQLTGHVRHYHRPHPSRASLMALAVGLGVLAASALVLASEMGWL